MQSLIELDTSLFLFLNSLHHPILDQVMLVLSYNYILMISLFLFLIYKTYRVYGKKVLLIFTCSIIVFAMSDIGSSKGFKDNTKRLRPCHTPALASQVWLAGKKCRGGKYGFVSSHSSNSFAISMFFWLLLRRKSKHYKWLFFYSASVAYSRIYLAKHFPLDIICGAMLGICCALIGFQLFQKLYKHLLTPSEG